MKIAIMGYSGSGKSTLAKKLSEHYRIPILHLDTVQFLPNWQIRKEEDKKQIVSAFLENETDWVIDGNYSKLSYDQRIKEADLIILLLFNRFECFRRARKRYRTYKNQTRPDMAEGCAEKFDLEFALWILHKGRSKQAKQRYRKILSQYPEKTVVIKNQRQLDSFERAYIKA